MKLEHNADSLSAISVFFESIEERAGFLCAELLKLEDQNYYKHHKYSHFHLHGSLVVLVAATEWHSRERGEIEFWVSFDDFFDNSYLKRMQEKRSAKEAEAERIKEEAKQEQIKQKTEFEYQQFLALKAKFEGAHDETISI
jgi:hypothetical protein